MTQKTTVIGLLAMTAAAVISAAAAAAAANQLPKIHVHPATGHFMDQHGRVRMFRGVNSVHKMEPWYEVLMDKDHWLKDAAVDIGMNVIRLGNMWTGWQPLGPDSFNETYAEKITEIMDQMEELGMYTLLDMHQDVLWKEKGIGYYGVPPWIKEKMNVTAHEYPWPIMDTRSMWECGYFTEHIAVAFQRYYENQNGVLDDNANFYRHISKRFKGRSSILGYEIINEPSFGDIYTDASRLLPGKAGQEYFVPYYSKIHDSIREHDQDAMIFWEPTTWSYILPFSADLNQIFEFIVKKIAAPNLKSILGLICGGKQPDALKGTRNHPFKAIAKLMGHKSIYKLLKSIQPYLDYTEETLDPQNPPVWGPGLVQPPGGQDFANRTALSWHYYCLFVAASPQEGDKPYKLYQRTVCDELLGPMTFKTVDKRSKEIGGGRMLTEFGECWPSTHHLNSQNVIECNFVMDKADEHFMSWTLWDSNVLWDHTTGEMHTDRAIFFARPYPQATAGTPIKLSFDWKTKLFEYEYSLETLEGPVDVSHPTEIVVPEMQYPNGSYKVQLTPGFKWQISSRASNVIEIVRDPEQDLTDNIVKVIVAHANAIF